MWESWPGVMMVEELTQPLTRSSRSEGRGPIPCLGSTVELTPMAGTGEDEPAPRAGEQCWLTLPLAGHTSDVGAEELSG